MKKLSAQYFPTVQEDALRVHDTFTLLEKFEAYCSPKGNVTYEHYILLYKIADAGTATEPQYHIDLLEKLTK